MKILVLGNSDIFQRKVYPALNQLKKIRIELASRKKIKENYDIQKSYDSYENALKKTKAKIVYISLINSEHFKWAIKSLKKNKHVIIDKPFTINFNETKKIISLAKKKQLFLSEAIVFQYHKQFKDIFKKIDLKKKLIIKSFFHIPKLDRKNFRNKSKFGGGCFHDMSSYATFMINFFFKNKNFIYKKISHSNIKHVSNNFKIIAKSKNILLSSSFSFNSSYKNYIIISSGKLSYRINFAFSPPIGSITTVKKYDRIKKKVVLINFKSQNSFYTYFNKIFNIIKRKKYNFFYDEIKKNAEIKKEIS